MYGTPESSDKVNKIKPIKIKLYIICPISSIEGKEFSRLEWLIFFILLIWYLKIKACIPANTRNPYEDNEKIIWIYSFLSTCDPTIEKSKIIKINNEINMIGLRSNPK